MEMIGWHSSGNTSAVAVVVIATSLPTTASLNVAAETINRPTSGCVSGQSLLASYDILKQNHGDEPNVAAATVKLLVELYDTLGRAEDAALSDPESA